MTTEIIVLGDSDILEKERGQIQGKETFNEKVCYGKSVVY